MIKILARHLIFEDSFIPADGHKYFPLSLEVPAEVKRVEIKMTYWPLYMEDRGKARVMIEAKIQQYAQLYKKMVSFDPLEEEREFIARKVEELIPLKNHLNFSIYDPGGRFRGRWDSPHHYDQKVTISVNSSETSPGFLSGPFQPGCWTVELETHGIISWKVDYRIEVKVFRERKESHWYKGELHLHSHHSDGQASLKELVEAAERRGLDFFALTDHNTVSGWTEAEQEDFLIIPGMELSTYYGHAVALGIRDYIDWRTDSCGADFSEKIAAIHRQGGLFSVAHPCEIGAPLCMGCQWEYQGLPWEKVDLMEIWSRSWQKTENVIKNLLAQKLWNQKLGSGLRIVGVGSNDLHDPEDYRRQNHPLTYVKTDKLTVEDILISLTRGRVYISSGPELEFKVSSLNRSQTGEIGDTVYLEGESGGEAFKILITVTNITRKTEALLYKNGELSKTGLIETGDYSGDFSVEVRPGHNDYYYWILRSADKGDVQAITNPIFFQERGQQYEKNS